MLIEVKKPVTSAKIEKAAININKESRKGFQAKKHAGKLKGVFGNALDYQKSLRDEWG